MSKKKDFIDDGWAVWITGENNSILYINQWVDPRGDSFVDMNICIRNVKQCHELNIYIPFAVEKEDIEDISHLLRDQKAFRAIFGARCVLDYMRDACSSELAYHGKVVDVMHLSCIDYALKPIATGTLLTVSLDELQQWIDNDEAHFSLRIPHKSLNEMLKGKVSVGGAFTRLRDAFSTPVISEKYAYSIRVNEVRLLPEEINKVSAFHRQRFHKVSLSFSVNEDYQINDANCYRVRRLEGELYRSYVPKSFSCDDAVTYEWNENKEKNPYGNFNFYVSISRESISKVSMTLYLFLLLIVGYAAEVMAFLTGL